MKNLLNRIHLTDNMDIMAQLPDKSIDLAIVDPPYGAGDVAKFTARTRRSGDTRGKIIHKGKDWNDKIPDRKYFNELYRVSKNQIIWGGNYFVEFLASSRGWIFWDKIYEKMDNYSDGELAWTSFGRVLKKVRISNRVLPNGIQNIHPTQKPVALYRWLLHNYAKEGDIILDTHCGSASSVIACIEDGFDYIACENDKDYHRDSVKRVQPYLDQGKLF